jgi:hypothetical protein
MLKTKWINFLFVLFLGGLCVIPVFCTADSQQATDYQKIGILPFSRLVSSGVKKQTGQYYSSLEKKLASALKKNGISVIEAKYPQNQEPFTYEEMEAPPFDIDAGDFATPEQILGNISSSSKQKFDKIIFGHLEEVSDYLYLVARVYSASHKNIMSVKEQKIKVSKLKPDKVAYVIGILAVEIKKLIQKKPQQPKQVKNSDPLYGTEQVKIFGLEDSPKKYYTVEYIYRKILEYEFYVHPKPEHENVIDDLVKKLQNATKKKLIEEFKTHSRSQQKRFYGRINFLLIYQITSKPTTITGRFISRSRKVFKLCILYPHNPGFKWLTYEKAKKLVNTMKTKIVGIRRTRGMEYTNFNDWRIPTLEELFAITRFLPYIGAGEKGYSFWTTTHTDKGELWTIRKFLITGTNNYGIDFAPAEPTRGDKAMLMAVRTCN